MERLAGAVGNERFARAFSKALDRAPLAVPVITAALVAGEAINPPIVQAQEKPQANNCITLVQTENKETGKKTSQTLTSPCGDKLTRVEIIVEHTKPNPVAMEQVQFPTQRDINTLLLPITSLTTIVLAIRSLLRTREDSKRDEAEHQQKLREIFEKHNAPKP